MPTRKQTASNLKNEGGLQILIEKLTTSGTNPIENDLHISLITRIFTSSVEFCESFRLIVLQLQQPHAQIRLGALQLVSILSDAEIVSKAVSLDQSTPRSEFEFRDRFVLQLHDIAPFLLPTTNGDKPLPPPKAAAQALQKQTLELLLRWERDASLRSPSMQWKPSARVRGQLSSLMRYLRSASERVGLHRLVKIKALLAELEHSSRAEESSRQRKKISADQVFRRELSVSREKYFEYKNAITDNLTSLESIIRLLVPDPFEEFMDQPEAPVSTDLHPISLSSDPREHGMLFGSTSGFAASINSSDVSINLEVATTSSTGSEDAKILQNFFPTIRIKLTEEIRILRDSGKEFVDLANRIHRPILETYVQLASMCSSNPDLDVGVVDIQEAETALNRLEKLTNQFSNSIRFEEETITNAFDVMKDVSYDVSGSSDEEDDFVDVPAIENKPEQLTVSSSDDKIFSKRMVCLTGELPWDTPTGPTRTSIHTKVFIPPANKFSGETPRITSPRLRECNRMTEDSGCIFSVETEPTRWRCDETTHRFWKPNDPAEFEGPETSQIEAVISFAPRSTVVSDTVDNPSLSLSVTTDSDILVKLPKQSTPLLSCWVPLPSGRICPRRDGGHRCRIHGLIVPRDSANGRPINPDDRLRLQAEQIELSRRKAVAEKLLNRHRSRRRYYQLEEISKTAEKNAQVVLRNRLLHPRSLRKLANALNREDTCRLRGGFSENFSHTFSR